MTLVRSLLFLLGITALAMLASDLGAGGKKEDEVVSAEALAKLYAESPKEFNAKYQGKTIIVEGRVNGAGVKDSPLDGKVTKSFLMLDGFQKPGDSYSHLVRCEESGPDFEGIRVGHKVRIQGVVQGHKDTLVAVELQKCKVVKVFADDYPPSPAAREEVKKLQGVWKVLGGEAEARKLTPLQAGFDSIRVEGWQVYLNQGTKAFSFGLVIDPSKSPTTIDLTGKGSLPCIYVLDKDMWTLVLPGRDKAGMLVRPNGFDTTKHQGLLLRAQREKSK